MDSERSGLPFQNQGRGCINLPSIATLLDVALPEPCAGYCDSPGPNVNMRIQKLPMPPLAHPPSVISQQGLSPTLPIPGSKDLGSASRQPLIAEYRSQIESILPAYKTLQPGSSGQDPNEGEIDSQLWPLLQDLLSNPQPDVDRIICVVMELLDGAIQPAYRQGWFDPERASNKSGARWGQQLEEKIHGLTKDALVDAFFSRDLERPTYGERKPNARRVIKPRSVIEEAHGSLPSDTVTIQKPMKKHDGNESHCEKERERRNRHREFQMESGLRCPEIAHRLATEFMDRGDKRGQAPRGPGKDQQLAAAIYAHEFSGRVVQSEHDGRKSAEEICFQLLKFIKRWSEHCPRTDDFREEHQHRQHHGSVPPNSVSDGAKRAHHSGEEMGDDVWRGGDGEYRDIDSESDPEPLQWRRRRRQHRQQQQQQQHPCSRPGGNSSRPFKRHRRTSSQKVLLVSMKGLPPSPSPSPDRSCSAS